MNRKMVVLLVFLLILVGIIIIGKQKEQAIQLEKVETSAANQLRRITAEAQKAKRMALEETRRIEAAAQRAKQAALEKARIAEARAQKAKEMAQEAVRQKAVEIQAKINDLVAQANTLLGSAEYQKAINIAQAILSLDPNSSEATSIIEKATAKLKEAAAKQVEAVTDAIQVPAAASGE
ncbi:MAG: hypothetical protein KAJ70_05085 [Candidatus Omnitrophica bacterium]|nr:hypothetical protein [Candidatus Omnitrophota bacterium]